VGQDPRHSLTKLDDLHAQFPSLAACSHRITSPPDDNYNCVAWVNRTLDRWYEPGINWPSDVPEPDGDEDLACYVALFEKWFFETCDGPEYEPGFLKIAIYADGQFFQHVARQLRDGSWSSKAGRMHDLRHQELDALHPSGIMRNARPVVFMKREDDGTSMALEETGLVLAFD
jgi:hypothetical protein